jgi:putative ABC transport system ATP-binding protein
MTTPIVAINLQKTFREGRDEIPAVAGVTLNIGEGEVVGLLGPSGSGKTTLLSMLGCILQPTSGSLELYGQETTRLNEKTLPDIRKRYISFIFQGFNLFPALTAQENVMLILKLKGVPVKSADQRVRELFDAVGLSERRHFLPRDLSGGQKQRVAIARALAADSPLILADEPTGNLDHANGRNVMEILHRLAKDKKRSVIVATHDNRIEDVFDRILLMEDGKIVKEQRRSS